MHDLAILIPARNEQWLARTLEDIIANSEGDTEVIAVLDGQWAEPVIPDYPRVHLIYHPQSIGQRAATNEAARLTTAKYVMKVDAHCAFGPGFDRILVEAYESGELERDVTSLPKMFNLHVFDWVCTGCDERTYQGPKPQRCLKCGEQAHEMDVRWRVKSNPCCEAARFDCGLHFKYWSEFKKRPEAQVELAETMSLIGACWMMRRDRFWELGGCDEVHGSWGQLGTEFACKSWLSGGRLVCNKRTWFAHLFRTRPGFNFPYPNHGIEQAREHSRWLWFGNNWPGQKKPLAWLLEKFAPVPEWHDDAGREALERVNEAGKRFAKPVTKGIVYYTCNTHRQEIDEACRTQLSHCRNGHSLTVISLNKPIDFGEQMLVLEGARGPEMMHRQILAGLRAASADVVFLCESDVLYHPSHFDFIPKRRDVFYYNTNVWKVRYPDGFAAWTDDLQQVSGLCAWRELLLDFYTQRLAQIEREGFNRHYEPGPKQTIRLSTGEYTVENWQAEFPNICIRHDQNLTRSKWSPKDYRNPQYARGWKEAGEVPGWGVTEGRFSEFLAEVPERSHV